MRAMLLQRPAPAREAPLRGEERPLPEPGRGQVRLRVEACAVCRTDLQLAEGDLEAHSLPIVPGHQAVGLIDAIGEGVKGWTVGERAGTTWLAWACGECRFCVRGDENLCEFARFTGWDVDGGYADAIVVQAAFAVHLPDALEPEAAAPLLCGGVIGYRALRLSGIQPGGRLGLYGFGASATLAIQVARSWDCEVYVVSRSADDLARADALGARWVGRPGSLPPAPLDAAVTFAPVGSVVVEALSALDRGATVAINAIHLDGIPAFSYDRLWWERSMRSVANVTRRDAAEFLELAASIPVRTEFEVRPLGDANGALAAIAGGDVRGSIVLVP
jgi:propanol-preferring alcohol dehydrogenase